MAGLNKGLPPVKNAVKDYPVVEGRGVLFEKEVAKNDGSKFTSRYGSLGFKKEDGKTESANVVASEFKTAKGQSGFKVTESIQTGDKQFEKKDLGFMYAQQTQDGQPKLDKNGNAYYGGKLEREGCAPMEVRLFANSDVNDKKPYTMFFVAKKDMSQKAEE